MISFFQILERFDKQMTLGSDIDPKVIAVIRAGLNIDPEFWNNFILMCNNPHLSQLLGIRKEIIGSWPSKIKQALNSIERMDSEAGALKKANLITTGY